MPHTIHFKILICSVLIPTTWKYPRVYGVFPCGPPPWHCPWISSGSLGRHMVLTPLHLVMRLWKPLLNKSYVLHLTCLSLFKLPPCMFLQSCQCEVWTPHSPTPKKSWICHWPATISSFPFQVSLETFLKWRLIVFPNCVLWPENKLQSFSRGLY